MDIKPYLIKIILITALILSININAQTITNHIDKNIIADLILHADGEPDNYRGKALEIALNELLEENSEVSYFIEIKTKTDFTISGSGFLTTRGTYDSPKENWLINVYLWHGRHDPPEKKEKIEKEVVSGNIESIHIKLVEDKIGFFSSSEEIVSDVTYHDM